MLRETAGLYVLGVASLCLLLSIDFLTVWARFLIEQEASLATVGSLMLYQMPWFLHMSLPIAGVFAVLLVTGRWARDSELKAAYAAGVAPLQLLWPLLLFGLAVSFIALYNNGYLEPRGEIAYNRTVASFYYERPPAEAQRDVSFFLRDEGIFYAGRIMADQEARHIAELSGVLVVRNDGSIISAPQGLWDSEERLWHLSNAEQLVSGSPPERLGDVRLPFATESEAAASLAQADTLTLTELAERIASVRATGSDARGLSFAFHRRIADAFSALIFVLIAAVLGLGLRRRSGGFAWTIVLLVLFYFLWTLSGDFFDRGVLEPVTAAWFTGGLVGSVGMVLALLRLR